MSEPFITIRIRDALGVDKDVPYTEKQVRIMCGGGHNGPALEVASKILERYDALAARLAEAERDAARYRWIRATCESNERCCPCCGYDGLDLATGDGLDTLVDEHIDAFLAPPLDMVPAPDGSRVLVVNEGLRELQQESERLGLYDTDQPPGVAEPWNEAKCSCIYATSKNTESVRKGFEMGGYVKVQCDYCKAIADKSGASKP